MQYCSVVPKEIVETVNFRQQPIGTGPFKFQYWKDGVKLVFRKNPNYFETEDEFVKKIYFYPSQRLGAGENDDRKISGKRKTRKWDLDD